jgi:trans-aconitate methyltransferase
MPTLPSDQRADDGPRLYRRFRAEDGPEAERLDMLCRAYDHVTAAHLDRVGVRPGARCLDIGTGLGSVAYDLADRVGPTGQVLATDVTVADPPSGLPRIRRLVHDITRDPLPEGPFDVIFSRAVLHFVSDRHDLLARLATLLRPGGVLAVETFDFGTVAREASPAQAAWQLLVSASTRSDIEVDWLLNLADGCSRLGLSPVVAERTSVVGLPGSEARRYWARSLALAGPFIARDSADEAVVDTAVAALRTHPTCLPLPDLSAVYGRRV